MAVFRTAAPVAAAPSHECHIKKRLGSAVVCGVPTFPSHMVGVSSASPPIHRFTPCPVLRGPAECGTDKKDPRPTVLSPVG